MFASIRFSNIPHNHSDIRVNGVWNNFEGLPDGFSDRIDQVLARNGYATRISGKTDWSTGSHSQNVYLQAWTMYARFAYDVNKSGGWNGEAWYGSKDGCSDEGTVHQGNGSAHEGDWKTLAETTAWIQQQAISNERPWFAYQGMNIVHPPYTTSERWLETIDQSKISVPAWRPLSDLHPCDFQSSMLKGCTPGDDGVTAFYSISRRRHIRRIYLAMIAEFDAMVGAYVDAVNASGVLGHTVFLVTSDHGDMQMERQQFYKMVPYESSASVPMVIFDGRADARVAPLRITATTQLIDLFPTIMELAQIPRSEWPSGLDGTSLLPLIDASRPDERAMTGEAPAGTTALAAASAPSRPPFVVSQFHGDDIAMSWFLIVQIINGSALKLIRWGSGQEVPSMLYNLTADPDEAVNLLEPTACRPTSAAAVAAEAELDKNLRSVVDYPAVALDVARYNQASFQSWMRRTPDWQDQMHKQGLRWNHAWESASVDPFTSIDDWLKAEPAVLACRSLLAWPPKQERSTLVAAIEAPPPTMSAVHIDG
mmetsp:Transcript_71228/g.141226  ORF Transcript_71228/g.141226 Transcript_71228/m.141226 type:complete len:538 (-) Transcript_71228:1029-2642(-)